MPSSINPPHFVTCKKHPDFQNINRDNTSIHYYYPREGYCLSFRSGGTEDWQQHFASQRQPDSGITQATGEQGKTAPPEAKKREIKEKSEARIKAAAQARAEAQEARTKAQEARTKAQEARTKAQEAREAREARAAKEKVKPGYCCGCLSWPIFKRLRQGNTDQCAAGKPLLMKN